MTKPRLIVVGPLPPPFHGPAVSTSLILADEELRETFDVAHLDTSDHRLRGNMNRWEARNVALGLRNVVYLLRLLRRHRGVLYLPISQGTPGFMRDSLFIHAAHFARWRVAAHLRGSELRRLVDNTNPAVRKWARLTITRVDSAAVMSESLRDQFDGLLPDARIVVVPNGTPDLRPNGTARRAETVLFLSNLRRRKGVIPAFEAALGVLERRPTARFIFCGEWEDDNLMQELNGRAEGTGDRISFLPGVAGDAKRELLLSSSVFLFPPVDPEGHPRVVLEAMSAGLPIVTTDRGAIAESVVDGEGGFVLAEADPGQLAEKLVLLLEDESLRSRMGQAARRRYLRKFTQAEANRRLAAWLLDLTSR